jgi:hypothetical protein
MRSLIAQMKLFSTKLPLVIRIGTAILFLVLGAACVLEVIGAFAVPQNWEVLLSPRNLLTIIAHVILLLCGVISVFVAVWSPASAGSWLNALAGKNGALFSDSWFLSSGLTSIQPGRSSSPAHGHIYCFC